MGEFFYNYSLFSVKLLTFIILALFGLAFFISLLSNKNKSRETIEIEKINDKYEDLKEILEGEILEKQDYKILSKQRKKEDKSEKKESKQKRKSLKKVDDDTKREKVLGELYKSKLFVLKFDGDIHASEVDTLREVISAVMLVATKNDEILVIIDSAGGTVHNYGLAASQLKRITNNEIKLTVAVDLVAASGGYMMACVANKIIAAPFAVLGSIGVLAQIPNFHKFLTKRDIDIEHHTAGEYKTTLTMLGKPTDKAREKFKEELEDTHKLFKQFVKDNRPSVDIDKLATGEHWYGSQCIELKLADELITSDDYIINACKEKDVFEVSYKFQKSFKEKISSVVESSITKVLEKFWEKLQTNTSVK